MAAAAGRPAEFKVVLLGATTVGKTSIVLRGVEGTFSEHTMPTIGAFYLTKHEEVDAAPVSLLLWDTAGQEHYRSMAPMYYRGAHAALCVFDVTSEESFGALQDWIMELQEQAREDVELFVVANKIDLAQRRSVQSVRAYEYAKSVNAGYVETSAKTGSGVADLFTSVAQALVKRHGAGYRPSGGAAKGIVQLPESASPPSKKRGCC